MASRPPVGAEQRSRGQFREHEPDDSEDERGQTGVDGDSSEELAHDCRDPLSETLSPVT